jgi:hypothetical protein
MTRIDNNMVEVLGMTTSVAYWNMIKFTGVVFLTSASWIIVTFITTL